MKVLALGGEPATGKTTLIFELMKAADDWQVQKPEKLLDTLYSRKLDCHVLGKYERNDTIFQGTDRLSMAVQPDAVKFIHSLARAGINTNVIFEGDRLFNAKFIDSILEVTNDFKIIRLQAPHSIVEQRHIDRKDDQDDTFKNSRRTKIDNICSSLVLMDYIEIMDNANFEDQKVIISYIKQFFGWSE